MGITLNKDTCCKYFNNEQDNNVQIIEKESPEVNKKKTNGNYDCEAKLDITITLHNDSLKKYNTSNLDSISPFKKEKKLSSMNLPSIVTPNSFQITKVLKKSSNRNLLKLKSMIVSEDEDVTSLVTEKYISVNEIEFLSKVFSKIFISFSVEDLNQIVKSMVHCKVKINDVIYNNTETSLNPIIIVLYGEIGLYKGSLLVQSYGKGDIIGDLLLIKKSFSNLNSENVKGQLEYKALSDSEFYIISSIQLKLIQNNLIEKKYALYYNIVDSIPFIKNLSEINKKEFSEGLSEYEFEKDHTLQKFDQIVTNIYYIIQGDILVIDKDNKRLKLSNGDFVNEEISIVPDVKSRFSIKVTSSIAVLVVIKLSDLEEFAEKDYMKNILKENFNCFVKLNPSIMKIFNNNFIYSCDLVKENVKNENNQILGSNGNGTNRIVNIPRNNRHSVCYSQNEVENLKVTSINTVKSKNEKLLGNTLKEKSDVVIKSIDSFSKSSNKSRRKSLILEDIPEVDNIFKKFNLKIYEAGEEILLNTEKCLVLLHGSLINSKKLSYIKPLSFLFLPLLADKSHIRYKTEDKCFILEASISHLLSFENKIKLLNIMLCIQKKNKWMYYLSTDTINSLSSLLKKDESNTEMVILKDENQNSKSIFYVEQGRVFKLIPHDKFKPTKIDFEKIKKVGEHKSYSIIDIYHEGDVFGSDEIFSSDNQKYSFYLIAEKQSCVYSIHLSSIECFIGKPYIDFIQSDIEYSKRTINPTKSNIKVESFIGKGAFGSVFKININGKVFAMKSFYKDAINTNTSLLKYLKHEKDNLLMLKSPFVLRMFQSFQDEYFLHFLLEYIEGNTVEEVIQTGCFARQFDLCSFLYANIIISLAVLDKESMIHRDIKPSNLILQQNGFIKLIDFGLSKKTKNFTYTIIGSPMYMSPEIIKGLGYGKSCDYWASAVILYRLYYDKFPFGNNNESVMEVYKEILSANLTFPQMEDSNVGVLKQLLKNALKKKISLRLDRIDQIQNFLPQIKWNSIMNMTCESPLCDILGNCNNESAIQTKKVLSSFKNYDSSFIYQQLDESIRKNRTKVKCKDEIFSLF